MKTIQVEERYLAEYRNALAELDAVRRSAHPKDPSDWHKMSQESDAVTIALALHDAVEQVNRNIERVRSIIVLREKAAKCIASADRSGVLRPEEQLS